MVDSLVASMVVSMVERLADWLVEMKFDLSVLRWVVELDKSLVQKSAEH